MGWVNSESEHTTEIKFSSWVGFEPTISWSTVQRVTTELSPLSFFWSALKDYYIIIHLQYDTNLVKAGDTPRLYVSELQSQGQGQERYLKANARTDKAKAKDQTMILKSKRDKAKDLQHCQEYLARHRSYC